ncbi:hypothetical protein TPHA_0P00910 [Tetrapisispora phaffii CBS 4417]|uniref:ditrans,polycis-polyprenyl diphosphate synthase [(2E,6E)-farnesyldiphosphate specific] n=1 Tax=Tetrapisispora phaffii (strain ATCC 24235 / CBS 4417 / NBRC 1672 / NRRL Y-8282 / UCD 70-5) TaxID=1071381 RepID=G8C271_TETPH|nr:hypothetical protein TPHA_0P00910 [Tetrapisispora phaffii CBS 4417]CCE66249.1 hypothetical protein TPHA_0P00910 [Tetrapisispora phaffii CBS 4417]
MSKIVDKVLDQHHREEERKVYSSREGPPESNVMKRKKKYDSKLEVVKAITDIMLSGDVVGDSEHAKEETSKQRLLSSYFAFLFYKVVLLNMYLMFGLFRYFQYQYNKMKLRILSLIYNPTSTPQLIRQDVLKLNKIPKRIAAILEMKSVGDIGGGLEGLLNDASEVICWTVSAGIKHLMLYDFDGVLKDNVDNLILEINEHMKLYYGPANVPNYSVHIPHLNKTYYSSEEIKNDEDAKKSIVISVSLLSNRDGRETIVDLTRTMSELCASKEMKLSDITMKLIDTELTHLVGHEPDLLLYFGPSLDLQGFPPWHIRLTEFYWETDNDQVSYLVFIRGLQKYSNCKINVGK